MIDESKLIATLISAVLCLAFARWRQVAVKRRRKEANRSKLKISSGVSWKNRALIQLHGFLKKKQNEKNKKLFSEVLLELFDFGAVWVFYIYGSVLMLVAMNMVL
ncbi:hypothetical protein OLH55_004668 [Vibrio parahaemolyticus]|nr:hypothetical protein [Vibrio parahaemolyticus]